MAFAGLFGLIADGALADDANNAGVVTTKPTDQRSIPTDEGFMVAYTARVLGSEIAFEMIPVPKMPS